MSNVKIKSWLADPSRKYEDGLSLYLEHRRDTSRDKFFNSKPAGTIHMNMLVGELSRISRILTQNEGNIPEKTESEPKKLIVLGEPMTTNQRRANNFKIVNTDPDVDYNSLPKEMQEKFDKIKELSKVIGGYKVALDSAQTNEDRKKFADILCNNWDERKALWEELDTFIAEERKSAKETDGIPFDQMSQEQIRQAIKLRKDYISRASKNMTDKNKAKTEKKIKAWESEIDNLEKLKS